MQKIDIHDINPYIRVARASRLRAGAVIQRRVIFDYELVYIESGRMRFMYNDIDYPCEPGCFILIRPGVPHSFHVADAELSQPHIHFDMSFAPDSTQVPISFQDLDKFTPTERLLIRRDLFEGYPYDPFVTFSDSKKALELFYDVVSVPRGTVTLPQKARLIELIHLLITDNFPECFANQQEPQYDVCAQLKAYMDAGQGTASTLTELEKQYSYSKYYLERQFKKAYGISLIAYRNEKRMQHARKLLETESVSDVAEELGFRSIYSFSRAFKKQFGICPSECRKK